MNMKIPKLALITISFLLLAVSAGEIVSAQSSSCPAGSGNPLNWILVEEGQDSIRAIGIRNKYSRPLKARYSLVSGTAIDGEDFELVDPIIDVPLNPGDVLCIQVRALYEPLPNANSHITFELFSRVAAYDSWTPRDDFYPGDSLEERLPQYNLNGLGYRVEQVFNGAFGFNGLGLTSDETFKLKVIWLDEQDVYYAENELPITLYDLNRPPVLVLRGTEDLQDWFANAAPDGIGFDQFYFNKEEVESWLSTRSDPEVGEFLLRPHVTGHSLGGALSQWFAASYTDSGGLLGEVVTFNSPGIAHENGLGFGVRRFKSDRAASVTHYITAGDLISLAGEEYLPGARQQSFQPIWQESYYVDGIASVIFFRKHSVPVLTPFIEKDNQRIDRPFFFQEFPNYTSTDPLNSFFYNYFSDPDYYALLLTIAHADGGRIPGLGPLIAAQFAFRGTVETNRHIIGNVIFSTPLGTTVEILRSWQAAKNWTIGAWNSIYTMTKNLLGFNSSQSIDGIQSSNQTSNFWAAAPQWPEAAWEASEAWPDYAWETMTTWNPGQWSTTTSPDFPWQETTSWSPDDWKIVETALSRKITGVVWNDRNANGGRENEPGRQGQSIYLDENTSGGYDLGEPQAISEEDGTFTIYTFDFSPGTYQIRQVLDADWEITHPAKKFYEVIFESDPVQEITGINFGNHCIGESCKAEIPPGEEETIIINDTAFLRRYTKLGHDIDKDTRISDELYACAVVGFAATGGDIHELYSSGTKIAVYTERSGGYWHIRATVDTSLSYEEDWDVTLLCISQEVAALGGPQDSKDVFIEHLPRLGDNVDDPTEYRFDEYVCGIVGFSATGGEINAGGRGDIIQTYLDRRDFKWYIRADLRTKGNHENWDIDLLCIREEVASVDGPLPDKPYFIKHFQGLGDNVGARNDVDTGILEKDYTCGVVGFAALNGDLDEHKKDAGTSLLQAYLYQEGGSWHIRADARSHKDRNENWDIDVLCILREEGQPPQWDVSHKSIGADHCLGEGFECQVLLDEAISLSGLVYVEGGGYSEKPTSQGLRCSTPEHIEVYINDRDPTTGKPKWSWPTFCVREGSYFSVSNGTDYDLRGVSIGGGKLNPIRLRGISSPPILKRAYPRLFPVPYGPGVALEWEPTVHPQATYYEIQYSEDGGSTWQVYTRSRDIAHGGWMNHHSNLRCGFGFERCLKRLQSYSYRVRVLNSARNPLTDWSNILSTTSSDWPAHVNLAPPEPMGPYPRTADVLLQVEDTFGQGLDLEWNIIPYNGATYTVLFGCENGPRNYVNASTCRLRIRYDGIAMREKGSAKLASLAPETSVDVIVTGTDVWGYSASAKISLTFEKPCLGKGCEPILTEPTY
jgi:hypothetical protein